MWHWLVDEKLIGSKECHDLRPSLTRHLTSTSCTGKQKQACATPSWPSRWRMISAKVVHFKLSSHKVSGTNTNKHDTCNKNKSQSQHISSHIFTHLHTSSHISTHLHTSSQISKHLHTSSHIFTHLHTSSRLGDGSQSVWDVSELEAELGRELSRKFEVFRSYVSHCRKHGDPETPVKSCRRSPKASNARSYPNTSHPFSTYPNLILTYHLSLLHHIALALRATCTYFYQRDNLLDPNPKSSNIQRLHAALAPAMLQLNLASALEDGQVTVWGEAKGVPEAHRRLHLGTKTNI